MNKDDLMLLLTLIGTAASLVMIFTAIESSGSSSDALQLIETIKEQERQGWEKLLIQKNQRSI